MQLASRLRDWLRGEHIVDMPTSSERHAATEELRQQTDAIDRLIDRIQREHDAEIERLRRPRRKNGEGDGR